MTQVRGFNIGATLSLGDMELALDYLNDSEVFKPEIENIIRNKSQAIESDEELSQSILLSDNATTHFIEEQDESDSIEAEEEDTDIEVETEDDSYFEDDEDDEELEADNIEQVTENNNASADRVVKEQLEDDEAEDDEAEDNEAEDNEAEDDEEEDDEIEIDIDSDYFGSDSEDGTDLDENDTEVEDEFDTTDEYEEEDEETTQVAETKQITQVPIQSSAASNTRDRVVQSNPDTNLAKGTVKKANVENTKSAREIELEQQLQEALNKLKNADNTQTKQPIRQEAPINRSTGEIRNRPIVDKVNQPVDKKDRPVDKMTGNQHPTGQKLAQTVSRKSISAPEVTTTQNRESRTQDNNRIEQMRIRIERYSSMEIEALYKEVKKYMALRGVNKTTIDRSMLENEFGAANIKKLLLKSYLILIGRGITVGK